MGGRRTAKKSGSSTQPLGRALTRDRFDRGRRPDEFSHNHTTELNDGAKWTKYQSVTEQKDLDEFLSTAELAGTDFTAERRNVKVIMDVDASISGKLSADQEARVQRLMKEHLDQLRIPRRPKWDSTMAAEELQQKERDAFLDWRRSLASLQEKEDLLMTPFERNIEVWRQLWRVVERCDLLVQIVDARNPLLFRCTDLEVYVREINRTKRNLLLINKADLLSDEQRRAWAEYLSREKIPFVFWSAYLAQKALDAEAAEVLAMEATDTAERLALDESGQSLHNLRASMPTSGRSRHLTKEEEDDARWEATQVKLEDLELVEDVSEEGDDNVVSDDGDEEYEDVSSDDDDDDDDDNDDPEEAAQPRTQRQIEALKAMGDVKIISRSDLFALFLALCPPVELQDDGTRRRATIGFVGYPNVGKSSTINVLCGEKRVAVAATPGKTKHFQTLNVGEDICLCDCPGLVFPNFATTKAELVCNGILPVDQLRDGIAPVGLICDRLPRRLLELIYGVRLAPPAEDEDPKRKPTAHELLSAYAYMRGFVKSNHGAADEQRAARYILKDMVNGKLLYCEPPPSISPRKFNVDTYKQQIRKYSIVRGREQTSAPTRSLAPNTVTPTSMGGSTKAYTMDDDDEMDRPLPGAAPAKSARRNKPAYTSDLDDEFFNQKKIMVKQKGRNPIEDFKRAQQLAKARTSVSSSSVSKTK